jgi:hypothetical protein
MSTDDAKTLAKALRCLDGNATDETLTALSEFGFDIGAILGMTTDSDDSDEIDEFPSGYLRATVAGELVSVDFGD